MTDTKDVILNIKTNFAENIDQLAKLQKELDDLKVAELQLNAAVKAGTKTREDADKELEALSAQVRNVKTQQREYRKEIDNEIKAHEANEGSIKQLRAELANMRKEYEEMSKAERQSASGDELLTKIQSTTDELKKLEAAQGDYRREVGHYQNAIKNLSPVLSESLGKFAELSKGTMNVGVAFKNGITQVKAFGTQLLKLLANPIVAIIAAIAAVVMKLVDSFKKNDAAMTELQSAFAAFKPVLDIIENGFQKLVGVVTKVVSAIGKVVKGVMSVIPGMKEYADAEEDIVRKTDALEDAERQYSENHEQREAEIAELREKAADSENYTYKQRKEFLDKAGKLEQDDLKERKVIAAEKVRIAEKQALLEIGETEMTAEAWEKLTDEQKDHITELRNELARADKDYSTAARKIKKEKNSLDKQEDSERQSRAKAAAEAAKERREKEKQAMTELQDMYFQTLYTAGEKAYSIAKANGEREIQALKDRLANEKNLTVAAKEAINKQIILKEADLQLQLGEIQRTAFENLGKSWGETQKQIDELRLQFEKDPDAIFDIKIRINEAETIELDRVAHKQVEDLEKAINQAEKDLMELDYNDLMVKYGGVFELWGIDSDSAITNMNILINAYKDWLEDAEKNYKKYSETLRQATDAENERIMGERAKAIHESQRIEIDLARKHAEIMRAIELENNYDAYGQNEVEKTRILLEQAKERQRIANEEYAYISAERKKYTDQEIVAIYGSLEAYNNAVLEANLKVIESENDVKDAMRDVANASAQQKITMIENATAIMGSVNNILGSMQGLFETMAESNESYADFATAMALMQILVSTAISIANAIQGATAAGAATGAAAPFTTPVFITEMISIVAGAIASATTTLMRAQQAKKSAPKFADGGLIGGHYASSESEGRRDDVAIQASRGEYIINANAVKRYGVGFLDSINGNAANISVTKFANGGYVSDATVMAGNYQFQMEITRQIMADAMSEIQPIVSVREITKAQNRVTLAERISKK
jgi:hypothetical protein